MSDVLVVQLTGRMHYGAARGLNRNGRLAGLLTDFYVPRGLSILGKISATLRPYCIDLPPNRVFGNPLVGLSYRRDLMRYGHFRTGTHIRASIRLAEQAEQLSRRLEFSTLYSFDMQAIETFQRFAGRGIRMVLEQCVAPRRSQMELIELFETVTNAEERKARARQLELLSEREEQEWSLADHIVCPSVFVEEQLVRWGVPASKITVVPYGFSSKTDVNSVAEAHDNSAPLRVIFVGTVEPRKGLQDLVVAVEKLEGAVELDVYGSLARVDAVQYQKPCVQLHGKVPFARVEMAFHRADVLVLPSYLEGSATVVYEALSYGVPCIVTHETGSVVRDGVDGFIVPKRNSEVLAERLQLLCDNRPLLKSMSSAALKTSTQYTSDKYGDRICGMV